MINSAVLLACALLLGLGGLSVAGNCKSEQSHSRSLTSHDVLLEAPPDPWGWGTTWEPNTTVVMADHQGRGAHEYLAVDGEVHDFGSHMASKVTAAIVEPHFTLTIYETKDGKDLSLDLPSGGHGNLGRFEFVRSLGGPVENWNDRAQSYKAVHTARTTKCFQATCFINGDIHTANSFNTYQEAKEWVDKHQSTTAHQGKLSSQVGHIP